MKKSLAFILVVCSLSVWAQPKFIKKLFQKLEEDTIHIRLSDTTIICKYKDIETALFSDAMITDSSSWVDLYRKRFERRTEHYIMHKFHSLENPKRMGIYFSQKLPAGDTSKGWWQKETKRRKYCFYEDIDGPRGKKGEIRYYPRREGVLYAHYENRGQEKDLTLIKKLPPDLGSNKPRTVETELVFFEDFKLIKLRFRDAQRDSYWFRFNHNGYFESYSVPYRSLEISEYEREFENPRASLSYNFKNKEFDWHRVYHTCSAVDSSKYESSFLKVINGKKYPLRIKNKLKQKIRIKSFVTKKTVIEFNLKNFMLDGALKIYSEDRTLIRSGFYDEGVPIGKHFVTSNYCVGPEKIYQTWTDGKIDSLVHLDSAGNKIREVKPYRVNEYMEDGKLFQSYFFKDSNNVIMSGTKRWNSSSCLLNDDDYLKREYKEYWGCDSIKMHRLMKKDTVVTLSYNEKGELYTEERRTSGYKSIKKPGSVNYFQEQLDLDSTLFGYGPGYSVKSNTIYNERIEARVKEFILIDKRFNNWNQFLQYRYFDSLLVWRDKNGELIDSIVLDRGMPVTGQNVCYINSQKTRVSSVKRELPKGELFKFSTDSVIELFRAYHIKDSLSLTLEGGIKVSFDDCKKRGPYSRLFGYERSDETFSVASHFGKVQLPKFHQWKGRELVFRNFSTTYRDYHGRKQFVLKGEVAYSDLEFLKNIDTKPDSILRIFIDYDVKKRGLSNIIHFRWDTKTGLQDVRLAF